MSQSRFAFQPLVDLSGNYIFTAALGDSTFEYKDADRGKPVKLDISNNDNYVFTAPGDEIEGFIETIEVQTVNQGYSVGSVRNGGRVWARVSTDQGGTAIKVRDFVVAGAQLANGTGYLVQGGAGGVDGFVKTGTPATFKWRVIRREGTGVAGSNTRVLLERA